MASDLGLHCSPFYVFPGKNGLNSPGLLCFTKREIYLDPKGKYNSHCQPYFFGYKTEVFFLPKHPTNLDLSYKTDLDHGIV